MNAEPMISICCLAYNHEKYIRQTLDSFLMQETEYSYEILIHDDASTDGTADIIREYQKKYPDIIKPVLQEKNLYSQGIKISKTILYPMARGKYAAICEGDDYWTDKNKLQTQVAYMEEHPECVCTYHPVNYIVKEQISKNDCYVDHEMDVPADVIISRGGRFCATASLCFRSEYLLDYPKYRDVAVVGDYPLQVLLASKGAVHYFPQIMGAYRFEHEGSWSAAMKNKERKIKQSSNEIEWLQLFDEETEQRYQSSIHYRIGSGLITLYYLDQISKKELKAAFEQMNFGKYKRNIQKSYIKWELRKKYPKMYSIYAKVFKN